MNKKNIGVLIASSTLIATAIGGGIAVIALAEDRSNAYTPTTLQKQRMSLIDTFFEEDQYGKQSGINEGNPFTMLAKAKLTKAIKSVVSASSVFPKDLDVNKINLIDKMSFLRLDKDHDALIIILDYKGKPFKDAYIKIDLDIDYDDAATFKKWGNELMPSYIFANESSVEDIYTLPADVIKNVGTRMQDAQKNQDEVAFLSSLDPIQYPTTPKGMTKRQQFTKSLIDSLILWRTYNINDPNEIAKIKTTDDLKNFINAYPDKEKAIKSINKRFGPFVKTMPYFPSAIDAKTAEIISPDMDTIEKLNVESNQKDFYGFEMSTMLGLILYPDAYTDANGALVVNSKDHRDYNPYSSLGLSVEGDLVIKTPWERALDNYKFFIKAGE